MGYFSNGTEGEAYESQYCSKCIHGEEYRADRPACRVWLAHQEYAYDLCNEKHHPGKRMLDMFIPREETWNTRCTMFIDAEALKIPRPEPGYHGPPIPDTPHGWMLKLCNHDNPRLAAPFRMTFDGKPWTAATTGHAALMLRGRTEWPRRKDVPPLEGVFRNLPAPIASAELADIKAWCCSVAAPDWRGDKPGEFFGKLINRTLLGTFIEHLPDGLVSVRAGAGDIDPVFLEGDKWWVCVMPMRAGDEPVLGEPFPGKAAA